MEPVYRSTEDMMNTRFEILAQLPIPKDVPLDVLKPIGIPERFTLHEFLLGSASGVSLSVDCRSNSAERLPLVSQECVGSF